MHELYIVVTHETKEWWATSLSQFNTNNENFLVWQKNITESSHAKSYNYNYNTDEAGKSVAIDLWTFSTKDELLDFYKIYSSEDSNINYNRPFPWEQMLDLINQAGVRIEIYTLDPTGTKEVLYDNKDLVG